MIRKDFNPEDFTREIPRSAGPAPVHLWDPPFCGDIDLRIARDGTWYYLGSPIRRQSMVRLFSSVLRRDGDEYFLVTPVEKLRIRVDDCPFVAVAMDRDTEAGQGVLRFTLNNDECITADAEHPLRVEEDSHGQPRPVLSVRDGLDALLSRSVFYELVEQAEEQQTNSESELVVYSAGERFVLGTV